jgi:hypothetical protein
MKNINNINKILKYNNNKTNPEHCAVRDDILLCNILGISIALSSIVFNTRG